MKILPSLVLLALAAGLHADTTPGQDPFASPGQGPRNISVCYETFSVPLALAAKLQREDKTDAELYAFLTAASEKDGVRQESLAVLRARSGEKATTESIIEVIYPTEYEPPSSPATMGVAITPPEVKDAPEPAADAAKPKDAPAPAPDAAKLKDAPPLAGLAGLHAPTTPTAFETRNGGTTLEMEATVGDDPQNPPIYLRLNPEQVTQVARRTWGQGLSKTEIQTFETQRVVTQVLARPDQPVLLGTPSRPPVSQADPDSAQRVWFGFATATIVQP